LTTLCQAHGSSAAASDEDGFTWRRIKLPDHGSIELLAPAAWTVEAERFFLDPFPTIELKSPGGKEFSVLITPTWGTPDKPHFNDPANVLKFVKRARDKAVKWATTHHIDIVEIKGEHLAGYYFSAIDRHPKPGDWKYMTHGCAALEDLLLVFTILSNDAAQPEAAATLIMLQKAKRTPP
jgi:hypothetical protein